ncbi:hypothetical protein BZG36_03674 [Bifiguratus adelaidae]|uniref:Oxidoreductase n=1 Tax=Bifiguratus adelaidae TaxID=1938954 RepID=A0A261XZS4_9FUNG|nr:hypothetical protein BZG36_03674 [Bifiguratus adelaidae]
MQDVRSKDFTSMTTQWKDIGLPMTVDQGPVGYRWTTDQVLDKLPQEHSVKGKVFIVTGGHSGLGEETTRALAAHGATVIVGSRSKSAADEVIAKIHKSHPDAKVQWIMLDLSDLDSVRQFVKEFHATGLPLYSIICNAGVMACPYGKTKQGFETQFGTNHLGHFLLIKLLIDDIVKSGGGRVVCVSSIAHRAGGIRFDDYNFSDGKEYEPWKGYGQSKTANILCAKGFNEHYASKGVECFSLHPGGIRTPLQRHVAESKMLENGWINEKGEVHPGFKTVAQGAATQVLAATSPDLKGKGGAYLEDCHVKEPLTEQAKDEMGEYSRKLFELSEKLVNAA